MADPYDLKKKMKPAKYKNIKEAEADIDHAIEVLTRAGYRVQNKSKKTKKKK